MTTEKASNSAGLFFSSVKAMQNSVLDLKTLFVTSF